MGEDLVTFKSLDMEANIQNILGSLILMIEANQKTQTRMRLMRMRLRKQ